MPKDLLTESESKPELTTTSESEQMYLITVARAEEAGDEGPVPIARIADSLSVSVPAANEMVRKLDVRGLLIYEPYRGVMLSPTGRLIADQVLRTRRLWATFLADHLGFSPSAADDQACHLEHATSAEAADRLATFLGNPETGPLGRPIPQSSSVAPRRPSVRLSDLPVGATAEVTSLEASGGSLGFLSSEGVVPGRRLAVVASGATGVLVDNDGGEIHLATRLAALVEVKVTVGQDASA